MDTPARARTAKVVLIGDSGAGKSCLHSRWCVNNFSNAYAATLGCSYQSKTVTVDGQEITLQLWDTAGKSLTLSHPDIISELTHALLPHSQGRNGSAL